MAAQPAEVLELVTGYAAGVSHWMAGAAGDLPDWCLFRRDGRHARGGGRLRHGGRSGHGRRGPQPDRLHRLRPPARPRRARTSAPPFSPIGGALASNGWAVGGDASASGHGMVVANPHFPWFGEARLWECHLTLPGELYVYGVSLLGTPGGSNTQPNEARQT